MKKPILSLLFVLATAGCATRGPTTEQFANADFGPPPSNLERIFKAYMEPQLIDPWSAHYDFSLPVKKSWYQQKAGKPVVYGWSTCVLVNAKNRMGGYTGWKPTYVIIRNDQIVGASENDGEGRTMCKAKIEDAAKSPPQPPAKQTKPAVDVMVL